MKGSPMTRRLRTFALLIAILAVGGVGGEFASTIFSPADAEAFHPCPHRNCDKKRGQDGCPLASGESGTYCKWMNPAGTECETWACHHGPDQH